jgi:hypothetical protein
MRKYCGVYVTEIRTEEVNDLSVKRKIEGFHAGYDTTSS